VKKEDEPFQLLEKREDEPCSTSAYLGLVTDFDL
jgi:hypothetical protein